MRYVALIIAVGWFLWFPIHVFLVLGNNPVMMRGPGNDTIQTTGVFEPHGYINFDVKTGVKSINGYHHTIISFEPSLKSDQSEMTIGWPVTKKEVNVGWPWGSGINVGDTGEIIQFTTSLDIPNDPHLKGRVAKIKMVANITYPESTSMASFVNATNSIEENIEITIGAENPELLSAWSRYWSERKQHNMPYFPVIIWILFLPTFWYTYIYVKNKSWVSAKTSHTTYPRGTGTFQQPNKPYIPKKSEDKKATIKDNLCLKCRKRNTNECLYGKDTQCIACYDFSGIETEIRNSNTQL